MTIVTTMSAPGFAVVRSFEGRSLKAYRDSVHVVTIGYGITNSDAIDYKAVTGRSVLAMGDTITSEQCEQLLELAINRRYMPTVVKAMQTDNQSAADAGGSFHYNCGAITRASWVKSYVAHNLAAVHSQIMSWNKAGGRVLAGLTRRRNREWLMIDKGDYGPEGRTSPVDLVTHKPVGTVAPVAHPGMLKPGDQGPEVTDFQQTLKTAGLMKAEPTGTFDAATVAVVKSLQAAHPQLNEDGGIVGPATTAQIQRITNLKSAVKTQAAGTAGTGTLVGAADTATGGSLPLAVYIVLGVVAAAVVAYTAWSYRDEIKALLFRTTPPKGA